MTGSTVGFRSINGQSFSTHAGKKMLKLLKSSPRKHLDESNEKIIASLIIPPKGNHVILCEDNKFHSEAINHLEANSKQIATIKANGKEFKNKISASGIRYILFLNGTDEKCVLIDERHTL